MNRNCLNLRKISGFYVFWQCSFLVWFWLGPVLKLWSRGSSSGVAPWWSYWSASITNTIGPAMGIEALKYISYPAQALPYLYLFIRSDQMFISIAWTLMHDCEMISLHISFTDSFFRFAHSVHAGSCEIIKNDSWWVFFFII